MPVLKKIVIQDFRNIELQELAFSPNINCICGGNGEGKTNLLDAIYYLSMTKSGIQSSDKFNFRHGCKSFSISGTYDLERENDVRFCIQVNDGAEKKVRRGDKAYSRISEHIGILPIVMVSPADTELVSESGDERRRFANAFISQLDHQYLADLQQYNRLLTQRNRLLKEPNPEDALLETFEHGLAGPGARIASAREAFVKELLPILQDYYRAISGGREEVSAEYRTDLSKGSLEQIMLAHRDRDKVLGYTGAGIQRDDFIFTLDGFPIRRCGSQGQQKSFLVALKFAQYEIMKRKWGFPPILLLDDLFDKLDMDRVGNLLQMVAGSDFGQIFISDTDRSRTEAIIDKNTADRAYFHTASGIYTRIDGELQD